MDRREYTSGRDDGGVGRNQEVQGRHRKGGQFCQLCNAWRGCLGLEPTLEMYVEHVAEVFREVWRVLRDDGTVWCNLGDSYASQPSWGRGGGSTLDGGKPYNAGVGRNLSNLKPKDLIGIPWRVAFALQADGWWLRSAIVWKKTNPMPESVTDRPTKSYEMVFLLAKSVRYFYDAFAIREGIGNTGGVVATDFNGDPFVFGKNIRLQKTPAQGAHISVSALNHDGNILKLGVLLASAILDFAKGQYEFGLPSLDSEIGQEGTSDNAGMRAISSPIMTRATTWATRFANGDISAKVFLEKLDSLGITLSNSHDLEESWVAAGVSGSLIPLPLIYANGDTSIRIHDTGQVCKLNFVHDCLPPKVYHRTPPSSSGRNCRDVWTLSTKPYAGAHFATYPPALVEPCIKAGTSERGVCPECGAPWERVIERTGHTNKRVPAHVPNNSPTKTGGTGRAPVMMATGSWRPTCNCNAGDPIPATVLDPFVGSGTALVVARALGRSGIGLDLSFDYLSQQARRRLELDKLAEWGNGGGNSREPSLEGLPLFAH